MTNKNVTFNVFNQFVVVQVVSQEKHKSQFPINFGKVSDVLYRGSWPTVEELITMQEELGVNHLVTLHSDYGDEPGKIKKLGLIIPKGVNHYVLKVTDAESFIKAAETVTKIEGTVYIHCHAGANRTGKTVLVAQVLTQNNLGNLVDISGLQIFLGQAMYYGFDHHKIRYKHIFESVLEILISKGKISL